MNRLPSSIFQRNSLYVLSSFFIHFHLHLLHLNAFNWNTFMLFKCKRIHFTRIVAYCACLVFFFIRLSTHSFHFRCGGELSGPSGRFCRSIRIWTRVRLTPRWIRKVRSCIIQLKSSPDIINTILKPSLDHSECGKIGASLIIYLQIWYQLGVYTVLYMWMCVVCVRRWRDDRDEDPY